MPRVLPLDGRCLRIQYNFKVGFAYERPKEMMPSLPTRRGGMFAYS
jgi:hypothetical protein